MIVRYEGIFQGLENTDGDLYEISTMTFSAGNAFNWPEQFDKIWYLKDAIQDNIATFQPWLIVEVFIEFQKWTNLCQNIILF